MPSPTRTGYLDGLQDSGIAEFMAFTLVALILMAVAAAWLMWRGARAMSRADRPWWGHPLTWVGASAVFLVLGLFVLPQLLGGVFIFLPFLWFRPRRGHVAPPGGCPACGRQVDQTHAFCPSCGTEIREEV